jgi:hypothetical protein
MSDRHINEMTTDEIFEALDEGMKEVHRQIAVGEMDLSGRYYTDEELAAGAATGGVLRPARASKATAA